jgi:Sec7-like guanine-nucleotide exchange factor
MLYCLMLGCLQNALRAAPTCADAYVAMYAVDALRQLAAKLLDRAELARFTHQGEALRPFAAVLRHSDSPAVRELAVACVAHAVSAHPRGLGSGWRSVLEALTLAARDASPTVVGQALDALQPVVEALFRPAGHTLLR